MKQHSYRVNKAFTLAELLIALGILGIIATFTIPKILSSQQGNSANSVAKETSGTITTAYTNYKNTNGITASVGPQQFTPFINYVRVINDGVTTVDDVEGFTSFTCGVATIECLKLHNGAMLFYHTGYTYGGTALNNAIWFYLDPDGTYGGSTTGKSKSVQFWLYANGKLRTLATIDNPTANSLGGGWVPCPACDPSWFSW